MRTLAILALASRLCAQDSLSDGITASASRSLTLPALVATFRLDVTAPAPATLDTVLAALRSTGLDRAHLRSQTAVEVSCFTSSAATPACDPYQLQRATRFTFQFERPAAQIESAATQFDGIAKSRPSGLRLTYAAEVTPSPAIIAEVRDTVLPQLITEARRKAESIAAAAGLKLGSVESVTDTPNVIVFDPAATIFRGVPTTLVTRYSAIVRFGVD